MGWVVSNSSTLIHLAAIDRLGLLEEFFGHILVPSAVWREVVEQGVGKPGVENVRSARQVGWIEVETPTDTALLRLLQYDLDEGEAEAIALAIEHQAELVLLDESEARRVADLYGLQKTGVIGLLIRARQGGLIGSLRDELSRLSYQGNFWIEEKLYRQALDAVGEEQSDER